MKFIERCVCVRVWICSVINYNPEPQICQVSTLTKLHTLTKDQLITF